MASERSEKSGVIWVAVISEWDGHTFYPKDVQAFNQEVQESEIDVSAYTNHTDIRIWEVELKEMGKTK